MKTADFQQPDGSFQYEDCDYEYLEDLISQGILGFCGCGRIEGGGCLDFLLGALELIDEVRREGWGIEVGAMLRVGAKRASQLALAGERRFRATIISDGSGRYDPRYHF